ncbi:MAG: glycoside hydrolase, partial [Ruminococcus sp.]|nr:glycoside hydrolase [Ruminococcus sp.]
MCIFKKTCALIAAIAISAGTLTAFPESTFSELSAEAVYVSNDFDVTYEGWINCGDQVLLTADEQNPHGGTRSMRVENRLSTDDGVSSAKGFYLEGGKKYDYSVFVSHKGEESENFRLTLTYLCKDGETFETVELASETVKAGEW